MASPAKKSNLGYQPVGSSYSLLPLNPLQRILRFCDEQEIAAIVTRVCRRWKLFADEDLTWARMAIFENGFAFSDPCIVLAMKSQQGCLPFFKHQKGLLGFDSRWKEYTKQQFLLRQSRLKSIGYEISPPLGSAFSRNLLREIRLKALTQLSEHYRSGILPQGSQVHVLVRSTSYAHTIACNITLHMQDPSIFYVLRKAGLLTVQEESTQMGPDRVNYEKAALELKYDDERNQEEHLLCSVTASNLFTDRLFQPPRPLQQGQLIATIEPKFTYLLFQKAIDLDRLEEFPLEFFQKYFKEMKHNEGIYAGSEVHDLIQLAKALFEKKPSARKPMLLIMVIENLIIAKGLLNDKYEAAWLKNQTANFHHLSASVLGQPQLRKLIREQLG